MPVSLTKSPALVIARQSWTRQTFRATLTTRPSDALSVPRSSARSGWTFHIVSATPAALQLPYSEQAAKALEDSSR